MKCEGVAFVDKSGPKPRLKMANKTQFVYDLDYFNHGQKVLFTVETFKDVRSLAANARMHVYFDKIAKYTGQDRDQVKAALKMKYLTRDLLDKDGNLVVDEDTGEVMKYVASTRRLLENEADLFIMQIEAWALDYLKLDVTLRIKN